MQGFNLPGKRPEHPGDKGKSHIDNTRYYVILEVGKAATQADLDKAYENKMQHPFIVMNPAL